MKLINRRLMLVKYQNQKDVDRLDTCLKMCCFPHVIFKEYEFVGGGALWKIYIDRGNLTWKQVSFDHVAHDALRVNTWEEIDQVIHSYLL